MNSSQQYHISVNDKQEFDVPLSILDELDLIDNLDGTYHLLHEGKSYTLKVISLDEHKPELVLELNGKRYYLSVQTPLAKRISALGLDETNQLNGEEVKAPMPGKVLKLFVEQGQEVQSGDDLIILEAMKMENVIKAGADGTITNISVSEGMPVDKNALLIRIESE